MSQHDGGVLEKVEDVMGDVFKMDFPSIKVVFTTVDRELGRERLLAELLDLSLNQLKKTNNAEKLYDVICDVLVEYDWWQRRYSSSDGQSI
jgi:hypothetical protein